mgnify:CR=1 FL=1
MGKKTSGRGGCVTYPCWASKHDANHARHSSRATADSCDFSQIDRLKGENNALRQKLNVGVKALRDVIVVHGSQTALDALFHINGENPGNVILFEKEF